MANANFEDEESSRKLSLDASLATDSNATLSRRSSRGSESYYESDDNKSQTQRNKRFTKKKRKSQSKKQHAPSTRSSRDSGNVKLRRKSFFRKKLRKNRRETESSLASTPGQSLTRIVRQAESPRKKSLTNASIKHQRSKSNVSISLSRRGSKKSQHDAESLAKRRSSRGSKGSLHKGERKHSKRKVSVLSKRSSKSGWHHIKIRKPSTPRSTPKHSVGSGKSEESKGSRLTRISAYFKGRFGSNLTDLRDGKPSSTVFDAAAENHRRATRLSLWKQVWHHRAGTRADPQHRLEQWLSNLQIADQPLEPANSSTQPKKAASIVIEYEQENVVRGNEIPDNGDRWGSNGSLLFALFSVSAGDIMNMRFPYLVITNGGGAFLVSYMITMVTVGSSLLFLELAMGRCHRVGMVTVWDKCAPVCKGIGIAKIILLILFTLLSCLWGSYAILFIASAFQSPEPWTICTAQVNNTLCLTQNTYHAEVASLNYKAMEFFESFEEWPKSTDKYAFSHPSISKVAVLTIVYSFLFFMLYKGHKIFQKVILFLVPAFVILLIVIMTKGLYLSGSTTGVMFFFSNFEGLTATETWMNALLQSIYSLKGGLGVQSYFSQLTDNSRTTHLCKVVFFCMFVNILMCFVSGITILSFAGHLSFTYEIKITNIVVTEPTVYFAMVTEAISNTSGKYTTYVLFFLLIFILTLNTNMSLLATVSASARDSLREKLKNRTYIREYTALIICILGVALSVICGITSNLAFYYEAFIFGNLVKTGLLFLVVFELIGITWIYGLHNLSDDMSKKLDFQVWTAWVIYAKFILPPIMIIFLVISLEVGEHIYVDFFPEEHLIAGSTLTSLFLLIFPVVALFQHCMMPGNFRKRIALQISPYNQFDFIKYDEKEVERFKFRHWLAIHPRKKSVKPPKTIAVS